MPSNPLLDDEALPRFSDIRPDHAEPAARQAIADADAVAERVLAAHGSSSWEAIVAPLFDADERVHRAASTVSHLSHVLDDPAMLAANRAVQPLVAEHASRRNQDERLRRAL